MNPAAFSAEIRSDSREDLLQSDWYVHIKKHDGDSGERMDCLSPAETGSVLSVLLEAAVRAGGSGLFVMTGLEQFLTETELSDFCRRLSGSGKTGLLISETGGTEHSGNHYYMNPSAGTAEADCTENGE